MPATVDYSSALLKLERAKAHLAELDDAVLGYLSQHRYRISVVQDFETGQAGFEFALKEPPPVGLAPIIGDCVHSLMCALDYTISAIAMASGRSANDTGFPFGHDAAHLDKRIKDKARKAGAEAMRLCADLKPYPGGNDALVALHGLDLIDKHRLLLGVAATGDFSGRYIERVGQPETSIASRVYFLGDEPQFVPAPPGLEGQVPFEVGLAVEVVFPPDTPLAGKPCVASLHKLVRIVGKVVKLFQSRVPSVAPSP